MNSTIYGIDVSRNQGNINWNMVKNSGTKFAFIRAGVCDQSGRITGSEGMDIRFRKNMKAANEVGLPVGAYLYSRARGEGAARQAVQELLAMVGDFSLRYPLAIQFCDMQYLSMSTELNTEIAYSFLWTIETAGYYPMLYTYKEFAEEHLDMKQLAAYDLWLAESSHMLGDRVAAKIRQYDTGACDGVPVACNLNVCHANYARMITAAGLNRPGARLTDSQIDMNRVLLRSLADVAAEDKAHSE